MVDVEVGQEGTHWLLHEKLLTHRSKFFENALSKEGDGHKMSLPDEENDSFRLFVGWLYSASVPTPREEKDLGNLFELYLMSEKWDIRGLTEETLKAVRNFYKDTDSYPALRRVQYIYANTEQESAMRQLLIGSIARMLVLGDGMPTQWDKALRKNGQLAVDIMLVMQKWGLDKDAIPDPRQDSVEPIMKESQEAKAAKPESTEDQPQAQAEGGEQEEETNEENDDENNEEGEEADNEQEDEGEQEEQDDEQEDEQEEETEEQ